MLTRRDFLQVASAVALGSTLDARRAHGYVRWSTRKLEPDLYTLAARAIDTACAAGASYADVRIGRTQSQSPPVQEEEIQGIGVRALVNGYWGFYSSAVWTSDEAVRLARGAVAQAKAHSRGKVRQRVLAPYQGDKSRGRGEWCMPVKYDPFDISIDEKLDVMNAFVDSAENHKLGIDADAGMTFWRTHQVFASSDGVLNTQTKYLSVADFRVSCREERHAGLQGGVAVADFLSPAGKGWEHVSESALMEQIPALVDFAERVREKKAVEVGRYDVVFTASAMATLLDNTLGAATELDRALGYEANAQGTSYLSNPLKRVGQERIGPSFLTITANRSRSNGAATVMWDDEGCEPDDFTIIKDGILVDYQTTRESAAWLSPYYERLGRPCRSHGCAATESALHVPLQHSPNIALTPGNGQTTFEDLVASTTRGIAVYSLYPTMDQQQLNGTATGLMCEIRNGKLGKFITGGTLLFRTPELWQSLVAIGGERSLQWKGLSRTKGQPIQSTVHSVGAVPAKFQQLRLTDLMQKA